MQVVKISQVFLFVVAVSMIVTASSFAGMITLQGVGAIEFSGWRKPSTSVKQEAITKAKLNALNRYTGAFPTAKMLNYEKIRASVEVDLDRYVTDYKVVDDDTDKEAKLYRVVIEASINESLIEVELQKASGVQQVSADERSIISFVFVSRKVKSKKAFDARRTERVVEEATVDEREEAFVEGETVGFASETTKDTTKTTGGSTLHKSDEIEYDVTSSEGINTTMNYVFSTAGYEVVEAIYLEDETDGLVNVADFIEDFRHGDDISGQSRRNAVKGCRAVGVDFFAIGTLDVGAKGTDQVTGLTEVYVKVNGKVMGLGGRFPKTIASVGPVQYKGLGTDQDVATTNALKTAGEKAAKELIAQLRAKEVK